MAEMIDITARSSIEFLEKTMSRHEGYFNNIWHKLDRLPRWASIAGAVMGTTIGALTSTIVHMLLARGM